MAARGSSSAEVLRQANHAVLEAVDGDDALRRLRTEALDPSGEKPM
jgi:hypothetical protein